MDDNFRAWSTTALILSLLCRTRASVTSELATRLVRTGEGEEATTPTGAARIVSLANLLPMTSVNPSEHKINESTVSKSTAYTSGSTDKNCLMPALPKARDTANIPHVRNVPSLPRLTNPPSLTILSFSSATHGR